ncbi:MAG TPA: hypothetical protein VHB23_13660 [Devosiaceae bacterium]|nr:hypothetical protein [Devosiaceae bacterium]
MIEAIGRLGERELLLSGWLRGTAPPESPALAFDRDHVVRGQLNLVRSDRPDVGPGTGLCGVLELETEMAPNSLLGVKLAGGALLARYERLMLLDEAEAGDLLARALGTAAVDPALRQRLEPAALRYHGADTLAASPLPIRLGIDDCVALDGGHVLLRGWLFDPERLVQDTRLGSGRESIRLADNWVRQRRPDVTRAMAGDGRFADYPPSGDAHGFVALARPADAAGLHLALDTAGGPPLYRPLEPRRGNTLTLLGAFIRAADPDAPGTAAVIERCVAPALAAAGPMRPRLLKVEGEAPPGPLALVIGGGSGFDVLPALLALLATDPAAVEVPIIIAGEEAALSVQAADLARQAAATGLRLALAFGADVADPADGIELGIGVAQTDLVCALSLGHFPARPGWLPELLAAGSPGDRAVFLTSAHRREAARFLASHPGGLLISPRRFAAIGGFPGPFLSLPAKWQALARALLASGAPVAETPAPLLLTADAGAPDPWQALCQRADVAALALRGG